MRKALWAISVCAGALLAQDAAKQPTAADLLPITEAVRDYYRASAKVVSAVAEQDSARARAQALQTALEQRFGCKLDLDKNVCTPPPAAKETK